MSPGNTFKAILTMYPKIAAVAMYLRNPFKATVAMCSKTSAVPPTLKKATVAMCYKSAAVAIT